MKIQQLVAAEPGWKAVFDDPDGATSQSRIVGWALAGSANALEIVGLVVDPVQPTRVLPAPEATSLEGGTFARYGFSP